MCVLFIPKYTSGSDDVFLIVNYEGNKVLNHAARASAMFGEKIAFEKEFEISVKCQRLKFKNFLDVTSELGN